MGKQMGKRASKRGKAAKRAAPRAPRRTGGLGMALAGYAGGGLLPEQRQEANFDLGVNKRGEALADFRAGKITAEQLGTIDQGLSAAQSALKAPPPTPAAVAQASGPTALAPAATPGVATAPGKPAAPAIDPEKLKQFQSDVAGFNEGNRNRRSILTGSQREDVLKQREDLALRGAQLGVGVSKPDHTGIRSRMSLDAGGLAKALAGSAGTAEAGSQGPAPSRSRYQDPGDPGPAAPSTDMGGDAFEVMARAGMPARTSLLSPQPNITADMGSLLPGRFGEEPLAGGLSLGYANGGYIDPRLGPKGTDTIPAAVKGTGLVMLDGGEYVLPRDTTRQVGVGALDRLVDQTHKPQPGARGKANGGLFGGMLGRAEDALKGRPGRIDAAVDGATGAARPVSAPQPAVAGDTKARAAEMMRAFMADVRKDGKGGYANGGVVYGAWSPVDDLEALNQERRQRAVFGRDPTAGDRVISDAEMAARAAPNTRYSAPAGSNLPERRAPGLEQASTMPGWGARTDSAPGGVPVDPRGRAAIAPPTVPGMYAGEPAGPPRAAGEYVREARMEAEAPALKAGIASDLERLGLGGQGQAQAQGGPLIPLFNPQQARADQAEQSAGHGGLFAGWKDSPARKQISEHYQAINSALFGLPEALAGAPRAIASGIAGAVENSAPVQQQRALQARVEAERRARFNPATSPFIGAGRQRPAAPAAPAADGRLAGGGGGAAVGPETLPVGNGPLDYIRPGSVPGSFVNEVAPEGQAEYGKAILSDSVLGATRGGLDRAIAARGQTASSPEAARLVNLATNPRAAQQEADTAIGRQWMGLEPNERGAMPARVADALDVPRPGERYSERQKLGLAQAMLAQKDQREWAKERRGLEKDVFLRDYDAMLKGQAPESQSERARAQREVANQGQKLIGDGLAKVFDPGASINPQQAAEQQWRLGQANLIAGSLLQEHPQLAGQPQRVLGAVSTVASRLNPDGSNYDQVMGEMLRLLGLKEEARAAGGLAAAR